MLHRITKKNDIHANKWNGLGGKFNEGESPEECVIREVYEESGFRISRPLLKGVLTFPKFAKNTDWYVYVFIAREFTGELTDSPEGKLEWIDDSLICDLNLWEGDKIFLEWFKRKEFFSGKFEYSEGKLLKHQVYFY